MLNNEGAFTVRGRCYDFNMGVCPHYFYGGIRARF